VNPFEVLGIDRSSSPKDIDKAYKELAKKYHPDVCEDPDAEEKFKEIQSAYELLSNKSSNNMHFRSRPTPPDFGFEFFSHSVYKGRNIQQQVEIELKDVLTGCEKLISYKSSTICKDCDRGYVDFLNCEQCGGTGQMQLLNGPFLIATSCNKCQGRGKIGIKKCEKCKGIGELGSEEKFVNITIPQGIESGMQLIFPGHGEESINGGIKGDLILVVFVKEHALYKREDANLIIEVPVSYTQLCLGCDLDVPCITGEMVTIKIPDKCQVGSKFKVKGRGIFSRGRIGDMIVCLKLEIPKNINKEYKEVLLKLSEMEKNWPSIGLQNWLKNIDSERK